MTNDRGIESARQLLRVTFGIVPFLAGLDKFFNLLADWPRYLSPAAEAILPVSGQTFMYVAGVIEMAVGVAILTRWTVLGSYVAAGWLRGDRPQPRRVGDVPRRGGAGPGDGRGRVHARAADGGQ